MYFVVSAGAPESIWSEKIVLDEWRDWKPTTCLVPPQAALEMGSFHPGWERGSPNRGPKGEQGSPEGLKWAWNVGVFNSFPARFAPSRKKKKKSKLIQSASWGFEQRELEFKMLHNTKQCFFFIFHCLLIWEFCVQLWPKKTKRNLYFYVTWPNLHCLP